MSGIEGFWVRNFGILGQVGVGTSYLQFAYVNEETSFVPFALGPLTLFAGANGTGKSTLLDAFMFVSDTLRYGVEKAFLKRGGFEAVYTHGGEGPISIGINYRHRDEPTPCTYALSIGRDKGGKPYIESELFAYREAKPPFPVFYLQNGAKSIRYLMPDEALDTADLNKIEFTDFRHLGLGGIEGHPACPAVAGLKSLLQNWYLSDVSPDMARGLSLAATARFVNPRGSTLADLVRFHLARDGEAFRNRLGDISAVLDRKAILETGTEGTGPLLSFVDPDRPECKMPATQMSDGFLRLLITLLLLEDPDPAPLIGIEEPENGLDRAACWRLIDILHRFAKPDSAQTVETVKPQLFLTTHHPGLADALRPEQVWLLERDANGRAIAYRAGDDLAVQELHGGENELPETWFSDLFEAKL